MWLAGHRHRQDRAFLSLGHAAACSPPSALAEPGARRARRDPSRPPASWPSRSTRTLRNLGATPGPSAPLIWRRRLHRQTAQPSGGGVDIIIAMPGRSSTYSWQQARPACARGCVVIDEADRMFDLGFIKDIPRFLRRLPPREQRQVAVLGHACPPRAGARLRAHEQPGEAVRRVREATPPRAQSSTSPPRREDAAAAQSARVGPRPRVSSSSTPRRWPNIT